VADRIDELIEEVLVDAYGEDEQLWLWALTGTRVL